MNQKTFFRLFGSFIFSILFLFSGISQIPVQTIRGVVSDADSGETLTGVSINVVGLEPQLGASTDESGRFRLEALPVGYYEINVSYIGYESLVLSQLLLESGKELVLDIRLTEKVETLSTVVLIGKRAEAASISPVSINTLTQEEVIRFPGTFYDPSRLVMTFPGVASTDDQANNIAIRGNSPNTMSWRLEGVEIVNPNHLSNAGTFSDRPTQNGGGVNILSAQLLGTSHFLTGAFPASYGNSLSGIMDMRLRPGNNEQYEFTAQAGVIGFDLAAEGPMAKRSDASFLINYRYSFIGLLTSLGVEVSDEDIRFQDLAFNLNIPTRGAGTFMVFGMTGNSQNIFEAERDTALWAFQKDRSDIYFENDMNAFGLTHRMSIGDRSFWTSTFAFSTRETIRQAFQLDDNFNRFETSFDVMEQRKNVLSTKVHHKFNAKSKLITGLYLNEFTDDFFSVEDSTNTNVDGVETSVLVQPFIQYQQTLLSDRLKANIGLHYQYHSFNGSQSLEPRLALDYLVSKKHRLSLSYGLHSQVQPLQIYFANSPTQTNENLGFSKAHHFVFAHNYSIAKDMSLKTELYYQNLFDIPISDNPESSFSAINLLEEFTLEDLVNEGTGRNYGVELGIQKTFSDDYFFLANLSLFESKYTAADGVERDTRFNSNYIFNLTGGKEFRWTKSDKQKVFGLNARVAYYGGFRDTPIDRDASILAGETVFVTSEAFSLRQEDFFKLDLRLYWKNNKQKYSSTVSLDVQNATNRENVAFSYFDPEQGEIIEKNQLGLIPVLSYRVEF